MKRQTCCFTGHRILPEPVEVLERRLLEAVEAAIQEGYLYFGAGGARGFDALASETVLRLKEAHPAIHLILVLPFDRQYRHEGDWTSAEIDQYHRLRERASKVVILAPAYRSGIYYRRNRHLVDHSSLCLGFMTRAASGTGYTMAYAARRGLNTVNLARGG